MALRPRSVLVGVASIPERESSLREVIDSLSPQADTIVVALNDYPRVPGWLARYYRNVEVLHFPEANGGDAEKFAAVDAWEGIVATCDDDVAYPRDYIARTLDALDRWDGERMVGYHGGVTLGWNGQHVAATHRRIRCLGELAQDDPTVNVLGTGVLMYDANRVPIWRDAFLHPNMADVHLAIHARTLGIPMVCLAHSSGWLRDICPPEGRRIYESNVARDGSARDTREARRRELARVRWSARPPGRPTVRVSIATCSRPDKLRELLDDLDRESAWCDLEIAVYEDPKRDPHRGPTRPAYERLRDEREDITWTRFEEPLGRAGHWQLVHQELQDARASTAKWFLFLPDDVRLVRHAIPRAIVTWGRLRRPGTLTLWRLAHFEGKASWTARAPVQHDDATETFHVDGLYLCQRDTLAALHFRCPRPSRMPPTGSGVGGVVSRRLLAAGKRMYRVDESLALSNDDGVSIMNPTERRRNPAVAL